MVVRLQWRFDLQRDWSKLFERVDIVVAPTLTVPFMDLDADIATSASAEATLEAFAPTTVASVAGVPAATVPVAVAADAPISVQIIAGQFRDLVALGCGQTLEDAFGTFTPIDRGSRLGLRPTTSAGAPSSLRAPPITLAPWSPPLRHCRRSSGDPGRAAGLFPADLGQSGRRAFGTLIRSQSRLRPGIPSRRRRSRPTRSDRDLSVVGAGGPEEPHGQSAHDRDTGCGTPGTSRTRWTPHFSAFSDARFPDIMPIGRRPYRRYRMAGVVAPCVVADTLFGCHPPSVRVRGKRHLEERRISEPSRRQCADASMALCQVRDLGRTTSAGRVHGSVTGFRVFGALSPSTS